MNSNLIYFFAILVGLWLLMSRLLGSRGAGVEAVLNGVIVLGFLGVPLVLMSMLDAGVARSILMAGYSAVYVAGGVLAEQSAFGLSNFLVLQWFGLRLGYDYDDTDGERGRWWSLRAPPRGTPVRWNLARWVWPLTGWRGPMRYIRRPRSRAVEVKDVLS